MRYVILRHELPASQDRPSHYDLMFEQGAFLRTWAAIELPAPGQPALADELPPHRLEYLAYEGPVSGGRGEVRQIATGEFQPLLATAELFEAQCDSGLLAGQFRAERTVDSPHRWRLSLAAAGGAAASG